MFIVGILSWWYGAGLIARLSAVKERIASTMDYFSIDLLLKTLFAPFRQISAGTVSGPIGVKWRAFVDRLVSRIIGAFARVVLIVIGSVSIIFSVIAGIISILAWLVVPLLSIVGIVMALIGWVPSWN